MKLVIQRVKKGIVSVDGDVVGKINTGLVVLLGVTSDDKKQDVDFLVNKLLKLRVMADKMNKMNLSIMDCKGEILVVSQFTLYANTQKGNRPSFIDAAEPKMAKKLYEYFIEKLAATGLNIQSGQFGEYMDIDVHLDGPVTIILDSNGR